MQQFYSSMPQEATSTRGGGGARWCGHFGKRYSYNMRRWPTHGPIGDDSFSFRISSNESEQQAANRAVLNHDHSSWRQSCCAWREYHLSFIKGLCDVCIHPSCIMSTSENYIPSVSLMERRIRCVWCDVVCKCTRSSKSLPVLGLESRMPNMQHLPTRDAQNHMTESSRRSNPRMMTSS